MDKSEVQAWIKGLAEIDTDVCIDPPFTQKSVYWRGSIMSLPRVVCGEKNGWPDDMMLVPVRRCGTPRCANGKHYRWGTMSEVRSLHKAQRSHKNASNPNSKLDWDAVRHIRAVVADAPKFMRPESGLASTFRIPAPTTLSHSEAMTRRQLAAKYGVSLRTIDDVVRGRKWKEDGDEF